MSGRGKFTWLVAGMVVAAGLSASGWARSGKPESAMKASAQEILAKARQGDANAEAELGRRYYKGESVPRDFPKAADWFQKAADQGNAKGEYGLATLYLRGQGVPQNTADAVQWTRKAADQGYARAEAGLGYLYSKGKGVRKSNADAFQWYRKSAEQGFPYAEYALGSLYFHGLGVAKDETTAAGWLQKAAAQGNPSAQEFLGDVYFYGEGVAQNRTTAAHWYREAAAQGNADGTYNLGFLYKYGLGVAANAAEATRLYRKAAAEGSRKAQRALGLRGDGLSLKQGLFLAGILIVGFWIAFGKPGPWWVFTDSALWLRILPGVFFILYVVLSLYQAFGVFPALVALGGFLFLKELTVGVSFGFILAAFRGRWIPIVAGLSLAILLMVDGLLLYVTLRFGPSDPLAGPFAFSMTNGLFLGLSMSLMAGYWLAGRKRPSLEREGQGVEGAS